MHCCAHALNLVLVDAVSVHSETQLFFGTAEKLYVFITSSLPQLHTLQEQQKALYDHVVDTLKRLSDTRWASRKHAVDAIVQSFAAILIALDEISKGCTAEHKGIIRAEAMGLLTLITSYSFIFMLLIMQRMLNSIFVLSNYLQRNNIDIIFAGQLIESTRKSIADLRKDEAFNAIKEEVDALIAGLPD